MDQFSNVGNGDVNAFEHLYQQYKNDPNSVDVSWQHFFKGFDFQRSNYDGGGISENMHKEFKVLNLINDYRFRGHLFTKTNPVRERRNYEPKLDIENYGLTTADLDVVFHQDLTNNNIS